MNSIVILSIAAVVVALTALVGMIHYLRACARAEYIRSYQRRTYFDGWNACYEECARGTCVAAHEKEQDQT